MATTEIRPETDLERRLYRELLAARLAATPCRLRVIDSAGQATDRDATLERPYTGRGGGYFTTIDLSDCGLPARILDDGEEYPASIAIRCAIELHEDEAAARSDVRLSLCRVTEAWQGIAYVRDQLDPEAYRLTIRLAP